MPALAIFDLDNTILNGQSQQLFLWFAFKREVIGLIPFLRINGWFILYKLGFIDDPKKVMEYAFAFLRGKNKEEIGKLSDMFFEAVIRPRLYKEALKSIDDERSSGKEILLLSNATDFIVATIARYLNVSIFICTVLEQQEGKYTGHISGTIKYGEEKKRLVREYAEQHGYDLKTSSAYADHHTDIPMLSEVGFPYAVNPTRPLKQFALLHSWPLLHFSHQ